MEPRGSPRREEGGGGNEKKKRLNKMFAVYLLSDPNGPPTAFLLFRPQCTVGVLARTHWGASDAQAGWHRGQSANPSLLHCCTAAALLSLY